MFRIRKNLIIQCDFGDTAGADAGLAGRASLLGKLSGDDADVLESWGWCGCGSFAGICAAGLASVVLECLADFFVVLFVGNC